MVKPMVGHRSPRFSFECTIQFNLWLKTTKLAIINHRFQAKLKGAIANQSLRGIVYARFPLL